MPDSMVEAAADELPEDGRREETTLRDLVDGWLREHYDIGLATIEEEFGDSSRTRDWLENCTSRTVRAVEPNEVTAGVDVTRVDVDEAFDDMPFMVTLEQYFPPEDDREGEEVCMHGQHAVLQTIAALAAVTADRFEEVPWDDA